MSALVAVTRPNGKVYRPRLGPDVVEFNEDGVAVIRTHDVVLAEQAARRWGVARLTPTLGWWRAVPWDDSYNYERSYITDEVRGYPVVIFR